MHYISVYRKIKTIYELKSSPINRNLKLPI